MYFGKKFDSFEKPSISLNGAPLEFVSEWKYLGVLLRHDNSFMCSVKRSRSAFYRSTNTVLNVLHGLSEDVQMKLLYSVCFPLITYACEVVNFSHKKMESLHVSVNDAIRKIFSYNRWQSKRNLGESFGYQSITEIFAQRRRSFEQRLPCIGNATLSFLSRL